MAVLLLLVLLTPDIISLGQGSSHCMTDCSMGQHDPLFMNNTAVYLVTEESQFIQKTMVK